MENICHMGIFYHLLVTSIQLITIFDFQPEHNRVQFPHFIQLKRKEDSEYYPLRYSELARDLHLRLPKGRRFFIIKFYTKSSPISSIVPVLGLNLHVICKVPYFCSANPECS